MNEDLPHIKREGVWIRKRRALGQVDWTPLNAEGKKVFDALVDDIVYQCPGTDWKWASETTLRTKDPNLSDAFESAIYEENPNAVITEYVNGKPRWSAKGATSLEMSYVQFTEGLLSPEEAWIAAGNDCECGNGGAQCFNSAHAKMRAEMEAWK